MPDLSGIPPGRAGRSWLRRRLATAERGREQLDRKLRILFPEHQRLRIQAARVRADWEAACTEADGWLLRASLLGGQDAVRGASLLEPARVDVRWRATMGLTYPADAHVTAAPETVGPPPGNAALAPAAAAFRAALVAGVRTAAAEEAVRRVEAEIAVTRRRLRALDKHWLPTLHQQLARRELTLEQGEQEDGLRLRRAAAALEQGRPRP